jgi:hypothetical protein
VISEMSEWLFDQAASRVLLAHPAGVRVTSNCSAGGTIVSGESAVTVMVCGVGLTASPVHVVAPGCCCPTTRVKPPSPGTRVAPASRPVVSSTKI